MELELEAKRRTWIWLGQSNQGLTNLVMAVLRQQSMATTTRDMDSDQYRNAIQKQRAAIFRSCNSEADCKAARRM